MFLIFGRVFILQIILFTSCTHSSKYAWDHNFRLNTTVCTTDECKHHASYIASLLNHDIKPCDDFYGFVCSNWQKKHPIPPSYPEWKVDSELEEIAFDRIKKILEEAPSKHDFSGLVKAKKLYKDCTDIPSLGMIDGLTMRTYVEKAGDFPLLFSKKEKTFYVQPWLNIHNYYLSLTGESALFSIYSLADPRNDFNSLLHVAEIESPYGLIKMRKRLTFKEEKIYRVFLATAVSRVIPQTTHELPYAIIEHRLSDIFHFRDDLMMTLSMKPTNEYNVITVKELTYWYNKDIKDNIFKAHIPWVNVISSLYNNTKPRNVIKNMRVNLKNKSYFRALSNLLSKTPEHVIVNHIHLYFIERHLELDAYLYKMLLDVIVHDGKLEGVLKYFGQQWQACITSNAMRKVLANVYVRKYLPLSTREKVQSLISDLQKMLLIQVGDCTWLDKDVVKEAKVLIESLKLCIEFEPIEDMTVSSEYSMIPFTDTGIVDVFYSRSSNCISISASYFEPPIYSPQLPHTVTLGSIGAIFGHEMYHAFEPIFTITQSSTTSKHSCCSKNMVSQYVTKTKCFLKQFDKVPVEELEHIKPTPKIDGHKTLNENIADSMGLRLAYQVHRKKMWETGACQVLPNLPKITCDQTFFISFAASFCSSARVDKMLENLETEDHSTPRLRVNGAVSNMKEFSEVFHCHENTVMNPRHKCNLWE